MGSENQPEIRGGLWYDHGQMYACALFSIGISLASLAAATQNDSGVLRGVVQDVNGAPVAEAKAELQSETSGHVRRSETSSFGAFSFDGLPAGEYRLTLRSPGFKALRFRFLAIAQGEQKSMPILTLSVATMGDCTGLAVDYIRLLPAGSPTGQLGGSVREDLYPKLAEGPVLPDAEVMLVCNGTKICGATRTNGLGQFTFRNLAPGLYSILVNRSGFYPWERPDYAVRKGQELVYTPIYLERCLQGNCDPALRPKRPLAVCE